MKTVSANEIAPAELAKLMADKDDDTLGTWLDGSVIGDEQDNQSLWEIFIDNEIFFNDVRRVL